MPANNDQQKANSTLIFSRNLSRLIGQKTKNSKISQAQFAKENNMSVAALNQWCNGNRFPGDENLDRLCEILQVPLAAFFLEPGQSINFDNEDKENTVSENAGNDLCVSNLPDAIETIRANGKKDFTINFVTDRLAPSILPNDTIRCEFPDDLKNGCTALCLFGHQFCICSVQETENTFIFTNLNDPSQTWKLDSESVPSSVLGIAVSVTHPF